MTSEKAALMALMGMKAVQHSLTLEQFAKVMDAISDGIDEGSRPDNVAYVANQLIEISVINNIIQKCKSIALQAG